MENRQTSRLVIVVLALFTAAPVFFAGCTGTPGMPTSTAATTPPPTVFTTPTAVEDTSAAIGTEAGETVTVPSLPSTESDSTGTTETVTATPLSTGTATSWTTSNIETDSRNSAGGPASDQIGTVPTSSAPGTPTSAPITQPSTTATTIASSRAMTSTNDATTQTTVGSKPTTVQSKNPSSMLVIRMTAISDGYVTGQVEGPDLSEMRVTLYIKVRGAWWGPKPYWDEPYTTIRADGTWRTSYVTGGVDNEASEAAAYLIPASFAPPNLHGDNSLPGELSQFPSIKKSI